MSHQIKITGSGTPEEIAEALRQIANAIHHPTSMGGGMNLCIDNEVWEDAILCTEIAEIDRYPNKSPEASKVLKLMDQDKTYTEALEIVLKETGADRTILETELNLYI